MLPRITAEPFGITQLQHPWAEPRLLREPGDDITVAAIVSQPGKHRNLAGTGPVFAHGAKGTPAGTLHQDTATDAQFLYRNAIELADL
jgi:hypothetical protein